MVRDRMRLDWLSMALRCVHVVNGQKCFKTQKMAETPPPSIELVFTTKSPSSLYCSRGKKPDRIIMAPFDCYDNDKCDKKFAF